MSSAQYNWEMSGYREFIARIGTFFLVIGAFLFVMFVSSDLAKVADFEYLFLSMLAIGIGWWLRRGRPRTAASNRFAWLRSRRSPNKKQEEKR